MVVIFNTIHVHSDCSKNFCFTSEMTYSENSVKYDCYDLIDEQLFIHHGTRHCPESKQPTQNVENEVFITVGGALWRVYVSISFNESKIFPLF